MQLLIALGVVSGIVQLALSACLLYMAVQAIQLNLVPALVRYFEK